MATQLPLASRLHSEYQSRMFHCSKLGRISVESLVLCILLIGRKFSLSKVYVSNKVLLA